MKRVALVAAIQLVLTTAGASLCAAADRVPTFTKDVAPILYAKCISCHRAGEVAPMSLIKYTEARPWAKAIRGKVMSREMPPWGADPKHGTFRNDNSLTQQEIDTLSAWAQGGTPKGEDADMPPVPSFFTGWTAAEAAGADPDFVIEMMKPYTVPAEGELPNLNFYTPIPFKNDRFSRFLEARPGTRSLVHHYTVSVNDLPAGSRLD